MSWKNIAIRRMNLADQHDFEQKVTSHPAVESIDNEFFLPIEKIQNKLKYLTNPTSDEQENIVLFPENDDEGDLFFKLKPGYQIAGEHHAMAFTRKDIYSALNNIDPCNCVFCMTDHELHSACTEDQCHLSGWFDKNMPLPKGHEEGDHVNCNTIFCEDVLNSHLNKNHSRCSAIWCPQKQEQNETSYFWQKLDKAVE